MATYKQIKPLLEWRLSRMTRTDRDECSAARLVESLSVRHLPYLYIPSRFSPAVVGFRKRTNEARRKLCRRFLNEVREADIIHIASPQSPSTMLCGVFGTNREEMDKHINFNAWWGESDEADCKDCKRAALDHVARLVA